MEYIVNKSVQIVEESTTIKKDNLGGWWCVNQGTADAKVDEVVLAPDMGQDEYRDLPPNVIWADPIKIVCQPGAKVVVTMLFYSKRPEM